MIHQPVSMVSQCGAECLAEEAGLQRSALTYGKQQHIRGALRRCAIQIHITLLSFFTVYRHPGQLNLALHLWVGTMTTVKEHHAVH